MGRPYAAEMKLLPITYAWAVQTDVGPFALGVADAADSPLVVIASGGSLTAAHLTADLHQQATEQLARVMTPYEVVAFGGPPRGAAVIMFSAGGRNADIRSALESCLAAEPLSLTLVTGAPQSPAARRARDAGFPHVVAHSMPAGRDGFLATNSLLAFVVMSARAYAEAGLLSCELPTAWDALIGAGDSPKHPVPRTPSTLVTLHGLTTRSAAVDLESKCTEAGLATVQLADYRNFAHGRHHWLAKHEATVLTLEAPEDCLVVERTLAVIPRSQHVIRHCTSRGGSAGAVESIVYAMLLAGRIGEAVGTDPGRPGVPEFGRKLYSLKVIQHAGPRRGTELSDYERVVIERKARGSVASLRKQGTLTLWRESYAEARSTLERTTFGGIVFDYDGTLIGPEDRFKGPRAEVGAALNEVLRAGIPIGIATGRGRSVGRALRDLVDRSLWGRVLVGYYNGGDIAPLGDDAAPVRTADVHESLRAAFEALSSHSLLAQLADITPRLPQITVEPRKIGVASMVWDLVADVLLAVDSGVRVVRSSHSIDVLAQDVGKRLLVKALQSRFGLAGNSATLAVGDRGQWPGNDAEILATLQAMSVDETPFDPRHAWRWSRVGVRGVAAMMELYRSLVFERTSFSSELGATPGIFCVQLGRTIGPPSAERPSRLVPS